MSHPFPNGRFLSVTHCCAMLALLVCLAGCGGGSSHTSFVTPPPITPRTPAPSAELFAQHIQELKTPSPFAVAFTEVRVWSNVDAARWANINTAQGQYDFSVLDSFLNEFYLNGISDVLYTIGQVPGWASSNASDLNCDFADQTNTTAGGCDLNADINKDGTGTDATYIAFVTALAQHVNDPTYLQTHAKITSWEPWNEWYRNPVVYPNFSATTEHTSINATYAQMVRMTEDLRCVLIGTGCVSGGAYTAKGIDPTAKIVSPSDGEDQQHSLAIFQNFLYCNGTGSAAPIAGSNCNASNAGSSYVDVINTHFYEPPALNLQPENLMSNGSQTGDVAAYNNVLSATDKQKPFWSGEGSWGDDDRFATIYPDSADQEAAWVARYYLSGWSAGLARMYWYAYDSPHYGQLWNGSSLDSAGQAYNILNKWLLGAKLSSACSANGSVWTCSLTLSNGSAALIIWDTSQTCTNGTCPTTSQSVSSTFASAQDLTGTNNSFSGTVNVGIKPILLTASAADAP